VSEAGAAVLRTFDPENEPDATFAELNRLAAESPEGVALAAASLVRDPKRSTRYVAVYLLGLTASTPADIAALGAALEDRETFIRAIAGGALVGLGHKPAIPVLIDLLASEVTIPQSFPPLPIARLAFDGLSFYTGVSFGWEEAGGSGERAHVRERWQRWWVENGERLRWNPDSERYE